MATALVLGAFGVACAAGPSGVSDGQKDQLKALAASTRDRTSRERDALRRARMDLFQTYSSYSIDEKRARAARDRISAAQSNLLNIHLDNEIALRGILTAEQFQAFREIMKRRLRQPETLILSPPEEAALDRLPDKQMLDALGVAQDDQRKLRPQPGTMKAFQGMRQDSEQMLELYSNYTLDSSAARKLIDGIHEKQVSLLQLQHHRQQVIRDVLSQDQFQQLQQEITRRMAERERGRRREGRR